MAEITFDGLNENSLIMQWNTDDYGNPKSIHINNEIQQVSPTHNIIQLAQIPDEYHRARFVAEGIDGWLIEVRSLRELKNIDNYYVDYNHGVVYFHEGMAGRLVRADYYGRGVMFLSDTRIFHKGGNSFATTLDEVLEKSEDALKLIESTGGLNQAIELLEDKAEEGNKVADRLENFITETQFYGYTIVLSREAFVVRAKEDGNLHNGEMEDLTVDVVVYKGVKNLSAPDLDVRLYSTTNCECEIENQKLTVTRIDVDCIQAQAIIEIDCGDGLIAYRTIEVTKVFDGVSQFNVEMTNAFHSFSATHSGKIEEEQSVTCEFTVTKANEEFKGYVVGIQNVPNGITHNLEKPTENASSVTFTAQPGISLPDNASISVVFQFNDYVITKTFAFTKSKQGLSAKSLRLTGNQIIHYENPNYEGTPNPVRTSIIAQVTDLSGTPIWSYLEDEEWIVIDGQNGTNLNLYHNDRIWGTKHELTIKCELDGFSDEITLIKIANGANGADGANGAMGLSSYSVILSNESTTLRVGLDGKIPTEELTSQYTRVTAFRGADQITPTSIIVPQGNNYEVSVSGSTINLIDVDTSASTVNIPIEILLDNTVVVNKVWSIAKTEKGEIGVAGAVYSINVEGGTRAITYNQLNENPRPTFSGVFTAHIYENGNDITSQIKSWYWTTQGHFTGTSINSSFTPEIKDKFDESILNNSVTVTAIYNHMPISYTVPIVVSKDLGGLDWVTDWDSTKVLVRDTEVLTPKLFAGEYNPHSNTINGVAIGTDVLNDGQVQGITGYQNNKVSFLLATDGSLLIGNPFEDNGTGLSYNRGRFVLNVDEMAIAGDTVPTWDDMETQLENHSKDIINAIQDNIDSMNETLNDMTTFVDTILQDELITTLEKVQLDALFQTVTQEVNNIQAQYDSVINNPYLADEDVRNLEKCYVDYMNAYSNIVDVYNDVFGEPVVEEIEYTVPQEEYLMTNDFVFETVDVVDGDEVFDENMEEQPVMLADENVDLNPFMLDTLITQDGYIIITKNGQPIQMVTENTLIDFSHAVDILREYSFILQQAINEALLSISENKATQMVEEAKEEVRQEIADVDSALSDLETTMNGSFKSGLIGEQSKAILNERLMQLDIEKKDVDGQYEVLIQNSALDTLSKEKLRLAKIDLDAAHDVLVAKINQIVIDNLMTDSELQAVNNLISEYADELQNYSKAAQECNATITVNTANLAIEAMTDEYVFNKVTNYGVTQGLFIKDEKVYINSEYINTRNFKAVTDDGKETFKIDENGEVSITAKSLAITGSSNLATQDYVNTQIENLTNTNITFTLSNEFQIIPTDESYYPLSEGTYAIKVMGYKGSSEEITDFTIGTVTSNDVGIIPVVSNINKTIVLSVSPDAPLGDSNGYVDIPITYDNRQFNKRWSWAVSKQGNQATTVTITGEQFFKYSNNYTGTPTPSQIKVTANVFNSTETGKWQYDNNGTWVDCGVTDKVLTLLPTQYTLSSLKRVTLRYYVDSVFDTFTVACISDGANGTNGTDGTNGSDAYTVLLTNENHAFVANHLGVTAEQIVTTDVIAYKGSTPITPTIGTLPSVTGLTLAKSGVRITIKANANVSTLTDSGSFNIPITVDGKSFTKSFSWTKVKDGQKGEDGQDGAAGTNAKSVDLLASNMVFKSTDGGTTFSPDNITLTAQYQNLTHSRWQYSIDGGTTWSNLYDGNNGGWQGGITATSDNLKITIPKTCTFFTDTTTSIVFKAISTDESFYDVVTITKLYDVADVDFEGIAEDIAQDKVNELDSRLNQQAVFNRLTNNGTTQGIYLEDGELYVNGEFINSKNFSSVDNSGNQTFLIDENGNVHINANTFTLSGKGVPTSQEVLDMIDEYGQAENLLLKPNFNDGSLTNWNYSISSYVSVDTSRKHEDSTSLKLNYTGSSNAVMVATSAMSITKYEAGRTYKASMWIYVEDKTKLKGNLVFSASGVPVGSTSSTIIDSITLTSTNLVNNKWIQFTFDFVPIVDHTSPTIRINCSSGVVAWVTDFTLQEQGGMSQQQMVDILNGAGDGLYLVDGELLMNAEYIQTGTLRADLIRVQTDEQTANLLPFNYVTLTNAINTDSFGVMSQNTANVYLTIDLPIPYGGTTEDTLTTPIGYSKVTLKKGRSYWFVCEYLARWTSDKKYENGVGVSTATTGSKYSIGTGNNMDILLYPSLDRKGFNGGRNLLDRTDGNGIPKAFSGEYVCSGFNLSTNSTYGYFTLSSCADSSMEHYLRFMHPNPTNRYRFDSNATYTLSGYVRGTKKEISIRWEGSTDGVNWDVGDVHLLGIVSDTRDVYFEYTFTIPSQVRGFYISFQSYDKVSGTTAVFSKLKLEKSNKATPWCLSPADQGYVNPDTIEESKPSYTLASVYDFNASVKVDANAIYGRNWTTLISRIDCKHDFTGYLWLNLDGSGFPSQESGYVHIRRMQLTYAEDSEAPIVLDYLRQINEKQFILTDGAYFTNTIGIDGIRMQEGNISMTSESAESSVNINYDSIELKCTQTNEYQYSAIGNSTFEYLASGVGGSSVIIEDKSYGFVASARNPSTKLIDGIFTGIHYGYSFIDKNGATVYGRPDIYRHTNKWDGWELLGERVEPLGLVRRDGYSNITTQTCLCIAQSTGTGGTTYNGAAVFSEAMYNAVGNGQLINVNPSDNRIYVGNPDSILLLESAYGLTVNEAGVHKQIVTNGVQYGNVQLNLYTGSSIEIWADSDCSTTTERVWIGAGGNAVTITSSGTGQSNTNVRYNSKIMYHEGYQQTSTSDIRYKRAVSDVSTEDCYNMVKNTTLHNYLLLDDINELHSCSEDGIDELETELDTGYSRKVQMGIIAQDVLRYECGKYFVVQDIMRDDDGNITSDKYSIDAYNYASAILGGLQEEIKVRDEQYEELKKENEDLKARLNRLEQLILKGE